MTVTDTWCAVVPQKALARAKGRLALPAEDRRALAVAMLRDTVAALVATPSIRHTYVLWEDSADGWSVPETDSVHHVHVSGLELNQAVEQGADRARSGTPGCGVLVVPSDLPALAPVQLSLFLTRAGHHPRAFLPDADRTGTSLLTAGAGAALGPAYGPESRHRHLASGARELSGAGLATLRHDVDNLAALAAAMALGCGPHTRASLRDVDSRPTGLGAAG